MRDTISELRWALRSGLLIGFDRLFALNTTGLRMWSLVICGECEATSIRIDFCYLNRSVSSIFDTLASSRG